MTITSVVHADEVGKFACDYRNGLIRIFACRQMLQCVAGTSDSGYASTSGRGAGMPRAAGG